MNNLSLVIPVGKICANCNEHKPITEFYKDKRIKKDGKTAQCRSCLKNKNLRFFNSLPDAEKIKRREKFKSGDLCRSYNYKKLYGITLLDAEKMLENQMNLCANRACGKEIKLGMKTDKNHRAFVDHNHTTGKVRGILCMRCNTSLGYLENKNMVLSLAEYMNKYDEPLSYIKE